MTLRLLHSLSCEEPALDRDRGQEIQGLQRLVNLNKVSSKMAKRSAIGLTLIDSSQAKDLAALPFPPLTKGETRSEAGIMRSA